MKQFANKSKFSPFYAVLQLPGITIQEVLIKDSSVTVLAQIKAKYGLTSIYTYNFAAIELNKLTSIHKKKLNLQMMKHLLCYILPEVLNRNHHEAVR